MRESADPRGGSTLEDQISSQATWKTLEECVRGQWQHLPRSIRGSIKNFNNYVHHVLSTDFVMIFV